MINRLFFAALFLIAISFFSSTANAEIGPVFPEDEIPKEKPVDLEPRI